MMKNDTISRQAAKDVIANMKAVGYSPYATIGRLDALLALNRLPSAERRGRWTNGNEGIWNAVILPKCSICGETFYEMNVNINGEYPYNYCPNCGARMDGHFKEPEINPCRGCEDYDGRGGCISKGGCGARMEVTE